MPQTPVTLDFSKAIPIGGDPTVPQAPQPDPQASALQGAVAYGATQNPDQYAHLLDLQKRTGIGPVVSGGNLPQVQQSADVNSIDYPKFVAANPRTTAWASTPDNAAVSGVDEVQRLAAIEQHRGTMASVSAYTPSWTDNAAAKMEDVAGWLMGGRSRQQVRQNFWQGPVTRGAADVAGGVAGMAGNIGSMFGWHGDGASKQNLLQRIETSLDPANQGVNVNGAPDTGNGFDWLMKNVAPMVPAVLATGGTSLLARTLGISSTATKVLAGLTVGGMFDLDQAGRTYTSVAGSGGSDYAARLAANRVASINALPNALFGATDVVPFLRDNPLLTSLGLGGATGASGQVGQNVVTGKPWYQGTAGAAVQGAAVQGGMHIGMGAFGDGMAGAVDAADQSKLRQRSPEKFNEAMQTIFGGDQSLRVPVDEFNAYFQGKGIDPSSVAAGIGSTNYAEAHLSGGDVEIPPADYLSKLDPEHQKALLEYIVDPSTGLTARQHQEGLAELQQFATGGGAAKLAADVAAADAETAATPEHAEVKEQLRKRYIDAGETPEVAEQLAIKDANVYSNLAREGGMKPSELLNLYNPKVVAGEAPAPGFAVASKRNEPGMPAIEGTSDSPEGTHGRFDPETGGTLFHGSSEGDVAFRAGSHAYLTADHDEANAFAANVHRPGAEESGKGGVTAYRARPGKTVNIDPQIMEMLEGDVDEEQIMHEARQTGARYAVHEHPSSIDGERPGFPAVVSLYPHEDLSPAEIPKVDTPEGLKPYDVARVPTDQLELDPKRFQYKMNVDANGVTNLLKGRPWNDDLAGVVSVWKDPKDGKTYVVNGHHRYQLAKETGQPDVAVRMIGATNAADARAKGALQNIAEGRGTAMDAAKFFRDSGHTPADLDRLGISMAETTATNGLALARLHPGLFDQVVRGQVPEGRAIAIGNATADPAEQEAILKLVNKAEDKGKHVTNDTVNELARMVKGAGKHTKTQETLFGMQEMTHSLALEKAEISSYIRNKMASEHKTFASVSDVGKAARLQGVEGQTINAAENSRIASYAAMARELYDRLSVRTGTVDDVLNRASRELAEGGKPNDVKAKAYADTRDALGTALKGAAGEPGGVSGENDGGSATGKPGSEPGSGEPTTAVKPPTRKALLRSLGTEDANEAMSREKWLKDTADRMGVDFNEARVPGKDTYGWQLTTTGAGGKELPDMNVDRAGWEDHVKENLEALSKGSSDRAADARDAHDTLTLFQSAATPTPRGWFKVLPDGTYEIGKTKLGDLSTFVHEPAHAYLGILGDLSKREGASETIKSDYRKVLTFLGAKEGEPLTREQHETWARANEKYLRKGEAPSPSLKGTFQRFGIWLHTIYKKASDLGVELTPEIRGVMDRLYAAEGGVNKAETESGPKLFATPEEAGWSEEQFKSYAEQHNMSADQAKAELLWKQNEAAVRDRTESWRNEEQNVREAMTSDIDQRPEYSAIRALRRGTLDTGEPLTISRDSLVKQFGEERVKALQKLHPGLYRSEDGLATSENPEVVAETFGFNSAEEMLRAMEAAPRRSAAIETATRDYMTAKHGDLRYDGTLDDQARIALENNNRAEATHAELTALRQKVAEMRAKASGQKAAMQAIEVAPVASYREATREMIEKKSPADLQPTRYLDANRKYSREAFDAVRSGNVEKAAAAKHNELMNHFLYRAATEAKQYVDKFEAYVTRSQKPAAQSKLGLAGEDYRDQFNRILGRYGLGAQVPAGSRTLGEWAAAEYEKGKEPAIDAAIYDESRAIDYRKAPLSEVRQVHDALINVRKLASLELAMEVNGKRLEFASAMNDMDDRARTTLPTKPTRVLKGNATLGERISDYAQRGDALLMRTERLMEWLDGGKTGPWHDNLWNHAADAQGHEYELQEQVTKQLGDGLENLPKEQRAKLLDKVMVEGIPETVTRHDLVSMAMNMGNEGNLDRLHKTFVQHRWDPMAIHRIAEMLTPEEWQFVQHSWDSLKPLGKAQADLEKRQTGLPPFMVKSSPLQLHLDSGEKIHLDGGYYPIVMDPRFSKRGAEADAGTTAQNLMEAGYGRAATSRGNMQTRTGFGGALLLDFEQVLTQHTAKVIKDITHREFMVASNKMLINPQMRTALRDTLGEGYEEKMMPWLRTIVNDRNGSAVQGLSDFSRIMRTMRSNLTLATLSYKISTSLLQWTHAPRMLLSTRAGSYTQAMVDFIAHPAEMTQQIKDLSPNEMAGRGDSLDRDIREALRSAPGIKRTVARVGNVSIKYTDHILSFPLWLSVYRDGLKEHVELPEDRAKELAMHAADSAVRLGLGSGAPKDLPPIMRSNDLSKLLTMFYSFHNGIYGQVRDIGHQFSQNGGVRSPSAVGKLSYGLALSVLAPAILSGLVSGNGPKDGENKGLWAAKKALLFGAETVPLLRDAASAVESDGEVKNPLMNMLTKGTKATQQALDDKEDKDWQGIGLSYLEVGGDLLGVPGTTQALKPLRYMNQVRKGNVENPNVWDAFAGSGRKQ